MMIDTGKLNRLTEVLKKNEYELKKLSKIDLSYNKYFGHRAL